MTASFWIVIGLVGLYNLIGVLALALHTRRRAPDTGAAADRHPVSVLKPLCGADPSLRANLESFFAQRDVELELLFGVEDPSDPAADVVRSLQEAYPAISAKLITTRGERGSNPKVRNLMGLSRHARHDLVLVSDSNVSAPPTHVRELLDAHASRRGGRSVGLSTCTFVATGEESLGGWLDAIRLNGFVASGALLPTLFGQPLVIGKTMLFSRKRFDDLGGLERLADVLAEDYVAGRMVHHAGLGVAVANRPVASVIGAPRVHAVARRHLRWAMLRLRLNPAAYLVELASSPLTLAIAGAFVAGAGGALAGLLLLWIRDVGGWLALRGKPGALAVLPLSMLAEGITWLMGFAAFAKRHVAWRGTRLRVGPGTILYQCRS